MLKAGWDDLASKGSFSRSIVVGLQSQPRPDNIAEAIEPLVMH